MATLIQSKRTFIAGPTANPNTVSATFDSTPSAGSLIVASVRGYAGGTLVAVTWSDNKGNSWAEDVFMHNTAVSSHITSIGSAYVTSTSATFTVTASVTNPIGVDMYLVLKIQEYSGMQNAHADKVDINFTDTSTTCDTTATATTSQSQELLVAVVDTNYNAGAMTMTFEQSGTAPSSGWTDDSTVEDTNNAGGVNGGYAHIFTVSTVAARHVWLQSNADRNMGAIATYRVQTDVALSGSAGTSGHGLSVPNFNIPL